MQYQNPLLVLRFSKYRIKLDPKNYAYIMPDTLADVTRNDFQGLGTFQVSTIRYVLPNPFSLSCHIYSVTKKNRRYIQVV
jgi:hypothetical protein